MKTISSRQNTEIITITKLKKIEERYKQQRFLAEGIRTCSTLVQAGQKLLHIYTTESMLSHAQNLVDQALETPAQAKSLVGQALITKVTEPVLQKISQVKTPSGMVGVFTLPQSPSPDQLGPGIVLDGITNPGNMGTLIRTCAAMGKQSIVVIEGVDPWNFKVIQSSAGTIGSVAIFQWSWQELLKYKKNLTLIGLVVQHGENINQLSLKNSLLVIGSEAHGITDGRLRSCDKQVNLEMPGKIESLNAAVAGSIAMYLAWAS